MSIDWDGLVLGPVMGMFGEGDAGAPASLPTYHPKRGKPFRLTDAVFDAAYQLVTELGDGTTQTSAHPVLGVRASLFPVPPAQGDVVHIPSVRRHYAVTDPRADGHGHILLVLIEAEF